MSKDKERKADRVFTEEKQSRVSENQGVWRDLGMFN